MANHIRQQIRERVGTTLTGLSTTGSNVFQSRVFNLEESIFFLYFVYFPKKICQKLENGPYLPKAIKD